MSTWRLQVVGAHGRLHDAFVDAEATTRVGDLQQALDRRRLPRPPARPSTAARSAPTSCSEIDLEHGDQLGCGGTCSTDPAVAPGRYVVVVAGPDAGLHVRLHAGDRVTFGRSGADVTLHDPFLSSRPLRRRARRRTGAVLHRRRLDQRHAWSRASPPTGPSPLAPGAVRAGRQLGAHGRRHRPATTLAVLGRRGPERVFARQFRTAQAALPKQVEAPRPTDVDAPSARSNWWRGAAAARSPASAWRAITGRWIFLPSWPLAPILIAVDAVSRKQPARRKRQDDGRRVRRTARRVPRRASSSCAASERDAGAPLGDVRRRRRPARRGAATAACGSAARATPTSRPSPSGWRRCRRRSRPSIPTGQLDDAAVGHAAGDQPPDDRLAGRRRPQRAGRGRSPGASSCRSPRRTRPTELRIWVLTRDARRRVGLRPLAAAHVQRRPRLPHRHRRPRLGGCR